MIAASGGYGTDTDAMAALEGRLLPGFCTISLDELLCITSPSDQKLKEPEMALKSSAALDLRVEEQLELVDRLGPNGLSSQSHGTATPQRTPGITIVTGRCTTPFSLPFARSAS